MDLQCGLKGPDGIVLMGLGNAEKSQHPVPQQPVDETFVLRNNSLHPGKDLPGDLLHLLGVEPLGQGRVAGKIREQGGNVFALRFRSGVMVGEEACLP